MSVLIAGCGDLGTQAGLLFAASGSRVVGWRRSPGKLPAQIEGVAADLTGKLPSVPEDTDVVVIALTADTRTAAGYRAIYYDGAANLLSALRRDNVTPRRIIFVSSTAVYGNDDGGWIDEGTRAVPATPTGAVLLETEELLRREAPQSVMLRLSGIYGPGRTRLIDQVRADSAGSGSASSGNAPHWTNRIHRDDAAGAIVHLAGLADPAPVYLGTDNEPVLLSAVQRFLAGVLQLPLPAGNDDGAAPATGKRCSNSLLTGSGFRFSYPTYREGYRAVLDGVGVRHP